MTTLIRTTPPSALSSQKTKVMVSTQLPASSFAQPFETDPYFVQSSLTGSPDQQMTFAPVSDAVITEIMGYVSLGLSEIGMDPETVPMKLYNWHTWLSRMNKWMKNNEKVYAKYLTLPPVKVSADLYFMSETINPTRAGGRAANTAPLGPLFPTEKNTMIKALQKGLETCSANDNYQTAAQKRTNFTSFLNDVNKLAVYAIQPHRSDGKVSNMVLMPQGKGVRLTDTGISVPAALAKKRLPDEIPHLNEGELIENFGRRVYHRPRSTSLLSSLPLWMWVVILMVVIYMFVGTKDVMLGKSGSEASFVLGPMMARGSFPMRSFAPVISISDMTPP